MKNRLLLLYLILACHVIFIESCSKTPSFVERPAHGEYVTLAKETQLAVRLKAGSHEFEAKNTGPFMLSLGNPDISQVLKVKIGNTAEWEIQPGSWMTKQVQLDKGSWMIESSQDFLFGSTCFLGQKLPDKKNILVISIDTLRADYFNEENMPLCFEFFKGGMVFDRVYTPAPWTLPAHASMFTSMLPAEHGVRKPEDRLAPDIPTLAAQFGMQGYYTLAVTEGNYLDPMYGLNSGFHSYISFPPQLDSTNPDEASRLQANIESLTTFIQSPIKDHFPIFAFLHSYEVHCPFLPRQGCTAPAETGTTKWILEHELSGFTEADTRHLKELYASEVRYTDQKIHEFLKTLNPDEWIIAFLSDHGEEFGEHGGLLHADTLFEEVLRVPMALKGTGIPNIRVSASASIMDLAPTLLALQGVLPPASWQGHAWISSKGDFEAFSLENGSRSFISESFFFGPHIPSENPRLLGITRNHDKLIQKRNFDQFDAWFFELDSDPHEMKNLLKSQQKKVDTYFPVLDAYSLKHGSAPKVGEMSEEQKAVLRSLGYTQ